MYSPAAGRKPPLKIASQDRGVCAIRHLQPQASCSMTITEVVRASFAAAAASLLLAACGGDKAADQATGKEPTKSQEAAAPAVKPTGRSTSIDMITDAKGERYDPTEVQMMRGDSLHFLLKSGVHNVHFVPEKNPRGVKFPPPSEYLQLPGQKKSYLIDFPEGRYYFQCDIHVALGMIGYVKVEDESQ
jgi:plastocyanin